MSLFDRRTDTEKELEAYNKKTSTNERKSPFDNTESTQNNTQSDSYNYGNENYNVPQNHKSSKSWVITVIFLVWFIGSVIALFLLADTGHDGLMAAMFGQLFLVFGIITFVNTKKSVNKLCVKYIFNLLFAVVGALIMAGGLFYEFTDSQTMKKLSYMLGENIVAVLVCMLFVIVGVCLTVVPIVKQIKDKKRCTVSVVAEIVDFKTRISRDEDGTSRTYAPVYKYYYSGREYTQGSDLYTNQSMVTGIKTEIFINPSDPGDIYEPKRSASFRIIMSAMGILFLVMGIFAIIAVLTGG
ncbi:MAG: DUF3592 domain-containing protein [Acutalibacteraceae bacterium]